MDDDNDPAPENIPDGPPKINTGLYEGQPWGWDGVDRRVTAGENYNEPSFSNSSTPIGRTYLEMFLHFIPMTLLTTVLIPTTSIDIINSAVATCSGWSVDDFWSTNKIQQDQENDPCLYNFRMYMSKRHFLAITRFLSFTQDHPPRFADKFWEVRDMIKAFNDHMASIFIAA